MRRLTDQQLSRVLTLAAAGGLEYYGDCVAVAAYAFRTMPSRHDRAWEVSAAVARGWAGENFPCNGDADAMLKFLESRGLA